MYFSLAAFQIVFSHLVLHQSSHNVNFLSCLVVAPELILTAVKCHQSVLLGMYYRIVLLQEPSLFGANHGKSSVTSQYTGK